MKSIQVEIYNLKPYTYMYSFIFYDLDLIYLIILILIDLLVPNEALKIT